MSAEQQLLQSCEEFLVHQTIAFEALISQVYDLISKTDVTSERLCMLSESIMRMGQLLDLQVHMLATLNQCPTHDRDQQHSNSKSSDMQHHNNISLFKLIHEAHHALNKHPPRHALAFQHIFHAIHLLKLGEPVVPASVRKRVIQQLNAVIALNNQISKRTTYLDNTHCIIQPLDPRRLLTYQQIAYCQESGDHHDVKEAGLISKLRTIFSKRPRPRPRHVM